MRQPTEYCDLVMKGGITSGLVYPQAVLELSERYRFKNIGGTSAGAIAAAICAAAALGEREKARDPSRADDTTLGMDGLKIAAGELTRAGFMAGLFQPAPQARAIYRLAVTLAAKPAPGASKSRFAVVFGALVRGLLGMAWPWMLAAFAGFILFGYWLGTLYGRGATGGVGGAIGAIPAAFLCTVAVGIVRTVFVATRATAANFLGLCPGIRQPGADRPALTDWMHDTIRRAAGRSDAESWPVTFGDLWNAPAYPGEPDGKRLNLQIITTSVSHSEPRTLPFEQGGLFFCEAEFRRLFPKPVVDWMVENNRGAGPDGYWELPAPENFPIVVAARMSLSFPVLISAIPLYERDFRKRPVPAGAVAAAGADKNARPRLAESVEALTGGDDAERDPAGALRRCWFTDGGVSSNFPVHLFDGPLPRWPTFAVDLLYAGTGQAADKPVFLPTHNNQGLRPRYKAITGKGPLRDLVAFLFGIIGTMQNWRDLLQGRAPGHRDRIVRVSLTASEGGMNINMPQDTLTEVARKGGLAGKELLEKFDFDNHFWVRYRNAASAIERFTISFGEGLATPLTPRNQAAYDRMWQRTASPDPYGLSLKQAQEAVTRLEGVRDQAAKWASAPVNLTEDAPRPLPQLRIVPIF
ncbi:MAG: patatin-like phospholipase family protein [Pseudomonadota bacterium]